MLITRSTERLDHLPLPLWGVLGIHERAVACPYVFTLFLFDCLLPCCSPHFNHCAMGRLIMHHGVSHVSHFTGHSCVMSLHFFMNSRVHFNLAFLCFFSLHFSIGLPHGMFLRIKFPPFSSYFSLSFSRSTGVLVYVRSCRIDPRRALGKCLPPLVESLLDLH